MKKLLLLFLLGVVNLSVAQIALTEGFESTTFPPTGWTTVNTHATNNWARTTNSINGDGSAYVQWIAADQDESLISPAFNLTGYTQAYLNFTASLGYEYMVDPFPAGNLEVSISNDAGATWAPLWVEEDYGIYTDYDNLYIHIDLSSYLGQSGLKVKFEYIGNDADTAKIDDVSVSSCKPVDSPDNLTALTDNTATLVWTGDAATYDFEWGPLNFVQGTGTLSNQISTTFNFASLTAGTGYTYYVRANCGTTQAVWQGPFTFWTTLTPPTALPYSYGFENGGPLYSAGWATSQVTVGTGGAWGLYNVPSTLSQDGTAVVGCFASTTAGQPTNAWLFSRGLTVTAGEILTINYYYRKYNATGTTSVNKLKSAIGTDRATAATTFTTVQDNGTVSALTYTLQTKTYTVPTTNTYYLGFNCYSGVHTATQNGAVLVDAITVTSNLSNNQFDLYDNMAIVSPNPVVNTFEVKLNDKLDASKVSLTVTDINGKVVKQYTKADSYDASSLQSGVYFLTVTDGTAKDVKKLIKQ
jgi:hypothetical protein